MLLKITNYCTMNCSHCMSNSNKNGEHMTKDELMKALPLITSLNPSILIVSGGEPTEHPNFDEFLSIISDHYKGLLLVTTNGQFLSDYEYSKKLFKNFPKVQFQITNDSRFYPKPVHKGNLNKLKRNSNVFYFDRLGTETVYPQGRATRYHKAINHAKAPKCFNLRSATRSLHSVSSAMEQLSQIGKYCTPSVDREGIKLGESHLCPVVASVTDSVEVITEKVMNSKCDDCGLCSQLQPPHLYAIGMLDTVR